MRPPRVKSCRRRASRGSITANMLDICLGQLMDSEVVGVWSESSRDTIMIGDD